MGLKDLHKPKIIRAKKDSSIKINTTKNNPPIGIARRIDSTIENLDYVVKVEGKSLVDDTEIAKIHELGSDNQDLSLSVNTNDERLTNARIPLTHVHNELVNTNDERLTNARTPITHIHLEYEPANLNIQNHIGSTHAPSNAQKNSDITKEEIEAKLTGELTSHSHTSSGGLTQAQILTRQL
jgi:hypothetical protein